MVKNDMIEGKKKSNKKNRRMQRRRRRGKKITLSNNIDIFNKMPNYI
jgi:hypothetical protein